jgi:hypothetical protein
LKTSVTRATELNQRRRWRSEVVEFAALGKAGKIGEIWCRRSELWLFLSGAHFRVADEETLPHNRNNVERPLTLGF